MAKKTGKKRTKRQREFSAEHRRAEVARLYDGGVTQAEIARILGVDESTISRDVKRLIERLAADGVIDFEIGRGLFLTEIAKLKSEIFRQYRLSKVGKRKKGDPLTGEKEQLGDIGVLDAMRWLLLLEARVGGYLAPKRIEVEDVTPQLVMDK